MSVPDPIAPWRVWCASPGLAAPPEWQEMGDAVVIGYGVQNPMDGIERMPVEKAKKLAEAIFEAANFLKPQLRPGDLLPCPFCGYAAEFERKGTSRVSCIVVCTNCGARHESSDVGDASGSSWNTRHR